MTTTLKPRSVSIPIYQGDDAERLGELRVAVAIAERQLEQKRDAQARGQRRVRRVGDVADVTDESLAAAEADVAAAQDAYDVAVDAAAEDALEVRVQAIGRRRFRDLVAAHPVRSSTNAQGEVVTNAEDDHVGVNVDTFPLELLAYVDPDDHAVRTVVAPDFKGPKEIRAFFDDQITDGDFEKIWTAAYWINRSPGADPKALRYSRSTGETSE